MDVSLQQPSHFASGHAVKLLCRQGTCSCLLFPHLCLSGSVATDWILLLGLNSCYTGFLTYSSNLCKTFKAIKTSRSAVLRWLMSACLQYWSWNTQPDMLYFICISARTVSTINKIDHFFITEQLESWLICSCTFTRCIFACIHFDNVKFCFDDLHGKWALVCTEGQIIVTSSIPGPHTSCNFFFFYYSPLPLHFPPQLGGLFQIFVNCGIFSHWTELSKYRHCIHINLYLFDLQGWRKWLTKIYLI